MNNTKTTSLQEVKYQGLKPCLLFSSANFRLSFHFFFFFFFFFFVSTDTLQAIKSSFVVGFSPGVTPPPIPVTPSSRPQPGGGGKQKKGVSSGVAAGISIVMLVVGIAGGLLIAHVIMKRRGTGLFSYQTQE